MKLEDIAAKLFGKNFDERLKVHYIITRMQTRMLIDVIQKMSGTDKELPILMEQYTALSTYELALKKQLKYHKLSIPKEDI